MVGGWGGGGCGAGAEMAGRVNQVQRSVGSDGYEAATTERFLTLWYLSDWDVTRITLLRMHVFFLYSASHCIVFFRHGSGFVRPQTQS